MKATESLVPAVVEAAVKPKPTKREIIDALAILHIEGLKKENVERKARRQKLDEEIEQYLKKLLHKRGQSQFKSDHRFHIWNNKATATVSFDFTHDDLPPLLRALMEEREKCEDHGIPHPIYARKLIAKRMSGMQPHDVRVATMLEDEGSRKALEEILKSLN